MISLGIESTAHTFGVGVVKDEEVLSNARSIYVPSSGGIHPSEARDHHKEVKKEVLEKALSEAGLSLDKVDIISFSKGPGLPPCLKVGMCFAASLAKQTKKPVIEVNHCIAHIEIGRMVCGVGDPVTLYVSGGNTQIIAYAAGRYRIFGETLDSAVGNAIDSFIRAAGHGHPGGPVMESLAAGGKYIELPYVVKGMDLSFSGILTAAKQKLKREKLQDICFSFQETAYAMLSEVTERAMAHTGKEELLLTGGVAASQRLQEMLRTMCEERGAKFYVVPRELAADNGAMIAYNGLIAHKSGYPSALPAKLDFNQKWRTDEVEICWI